MAAVGKAVRWTLSGSVGTTAVTRFWYIDSDTKGRMGAIVRTRLTRAACIVAKAASRSAGSAAARIRSRERRRYQVDRSSM